MKLSHNLVQPDEQVKGLSGEFAPLLIATYDSVFDAIVAEGWCYGSPEGDISSPTGRFARVLVEHDDFEKNDIYSMRSQLRLDEKLDYDYPEPTQGWYLWQSIQIQANSLPLTWVFELRSRHQGMYLYDQLALAYRKWKGDK